MSVIINGTGSISGITTPVSAEQGGTGVSSAGTAGNVLTSDGTNWASSTNLAIGVGQTWTNVGASRALGTTYTNSTGKPIQLGVTIRFPAQSNAVVSISINGTVIGTLGDDQSSQPALLLPIQIVVPNGATYAITTTVGTPVISSWFELR